jgi:hypothetical protein
MFQIESRAMEFLLAGEDAELGVLRDQFALARVAERENTGVGFFTKFQVPKDLPRLDRRERIVIGDVYGSVEKNSYGVGFLLFVENGMIDTLECFSNDGPVEENPKLISLYYVHPGESNALVEVSKRKLSWALNRKEASDRN